MIKLIQTVSQPPPQTSVLSSESERKFCVTPMLTRFRAWKALITRAHLLYMRFNIINSYNALMKEAI